MKSSASHELASSIF